MSEAPRGERRPHRRDLLDVVLAAGGVVWLGGVLAPAAVYLWPARSRGPGQATVEVDLSELQVGSAVALQAQGRPLLVIRTGEDEFHALSAICTHLGCVVHWEAATERVACPCHAGFFAPDGRVLSGPPPRPLPSYETSVSGTTLRVRL